MENLDLLKLSEKNNAIAKFFFIVTFTLTSACSLGRVQRHLPFFVEPTNILFNDCDGGCYFKYGGSVLSKYNFESKNHYEKVSFFRDNDRYSFRDAVSNNTYIFMELDTMDTRNLHKIVVYDKNLELKDSIQTGNQDTEFRGMVCNERFLYWREEESKNGIFRRKLYRYDSSCGSVDLLDSNFGEEGFYKDDEIYFFYNKSNFSKYANKTKLLYESKDEKYILKTDKVEIEMHRGKIAFSNNGKIFDFETKKDFNVFYQNAYVIDRQLVFATRKLSKDTDCGHSSPHSDCICCWKESYLFTIDLETNRLDLVEEYSPGTILIDFDARGSQFYYNGALYDHSVLYRNCELIKPKESKEMGYYQYYSLGEINDMYYLSYYNGCFYGI